MMASTTNVFEADELNFETAVVERSKTTPVLVDFWASWCGPCRALGPMLEKLAAAYEGRFVLAKVDTDRNQSLAAQFQVEGIPAVYLIVDGQVAGQFVGALPESELRAFLDRHLPSEADRMAARAASFEATDPVGARRLYEEALAQEECHGPSRAGLAGLLLAEGEFNRAAALVDGFEKYAPGWERAEQVRARLEFHDAAAKAGSLAECEARAAREPANNQAALDLGNAYAAAGRWKEALETLVRIVERDRDFGKQFARPVMVQVFQILGGSSEMANEYRSRLASAMY
jgi:putative thioredoxin